MVTSPDTIIIEGTGTYYIACGITNQSTDATVGTVIINNPDAIVYLFSNANDAANLCEFTAVYCLAGTVFHSYYTADTDDTGCYVKDLYISPINNKASAVTLTMEQDAYDDKNNVATNIYMKNGTLISDSPIGTFHLQGGTAFHGSEKSTGDVNQIDVTAGREQLSLAMLRQSAGTFNWYPDVNSGTPIITTAWILGGTFDASASTSDDIAKIIVNVKVFEGATINLANNKGNITAVLYDYNGTIITDRNNKVTTSYNQP